MLKDYNFFEITLVSINLFSFVLGVFFAATMWRVRAMYFVVFYFALLALYYALSSGKIVGI